MRLRVAVRAPHPWGAVGEEQVITNISIDTHRTLGNVDRRIFGGFVEHLGRCIYGGVYEEGSPLSDQRGFRQDVIALLKALRVPVLRWPGGNFVSNYHWQDGVGPRDGRPARAELAWGGTDSNRFGTDEYIEYCREIGAEPYICLNMGSGSLEEALAWVEYCNGTRDTAWAQSRRRNGHEDPHGVTWWGLGNEIYGHWQVGAMSADEYVAEATRWARAIKLIDPSAQLVSCGEVGWTDWDRTVIDGLAPVVDLHSIHIYTGSSDYWTNVLAPHSAERAIDLTSAHLRQAAHKHRLPRPPRIVYDEWNVWFREMTGALEERYVFADALAVGTYLNIFVRRSEWVRMANLAQMVNAIAPIVTTPETAVVQPIYYPILLHAEGHLERAVDTFVEGPTVPAPDGDLTRWPLRLDDLGPFQLVDAAATTDGTADRIAVTLVNRSEALDRVDLELRHESWQGSVQVRTLTGDGRPAIVPGVEEAEVTETKETGSGRILSLELPARSFTLVEAGLDK